MTDPLRKVLTIAGLDPSGGAGVIADTRAFVAAGVYGAAVVTALTVQDTRGVGSVNAVDPDLMAAQLDLLLADIIFDSAKTGMLPTGEAVSVVADRTDRLGSLVVDPVFISSSGAPLADQDAIKATVELLLPACALATPNVLEAELISGASIESAEQAVEAARSILELGAGAVCITGGAWTDEPVDVFLDGSGVRMIRAAGPRLPGDPHGTGCFFSAMAAVCLAQGDGAAAAAEKAARTTYRAIAAAVQPGAGNSIPWPLQLEPGPDSD